MKVRGIDFREVFRGPGKFREYRAAGDLILRTSTAGRWVLWTCAGSTVGTSPDACLKRSAARYRKALGALAQ
jgi:hypothetical protein